MKVTYSADRDQWGWSKLQAPKWERIADKNTLFDIEPLLGNKHDGKALSWLSSP